MKALLIGATGLVGSQILRQILEDPTYTSVLSLGRRKSGVTRQKLSEHVIDFKNPESWKNLAQGDVAFSALGTTKAQAGSIQNQYEVDFTYQADFAKACKSNGIQTFVLISSMGANAKSFVPYSKMKGELEDFINTLGFQNLIILRPGPLVGHREHKRMGEEVMVPALKVLSRIPRLKTYQPVSGDKVAQAAIRASRQFKQHKILSALEILQF